MANHHSEPVAVDPAQLAHANALWHNFVKMGKWFVLHVVIILALLAFFFIGLR